MKMKEYIERESVIKKQQKCPGAFQKWYLLGILRMSQPPPAGGRGVHLMNYEKLIERLNGLYTTLRADGEQKCSPEINTVAFVLMDAATSLSTLQAKNESLLAEVEHWRNAHHQAALNFQQENRECNKVLAELEKVKKAMAMMWFAYGNKDGEFPHEYEIEAIKTAEEILGPWEECMPKYLRTQPEGGQAMSMTWEEAVERREQK